MLPAGLTGQQVNDSPCELQTFALMRAWWVAQDDEDDEGDGEGAAAGAAAMEAAINRQLAASAGAMDEDDDDEDDDEDEGVQRPQPAPCILLCCSLLPAAAHPAFTAHEFCWR